MSMPNRVRAYLVAEWYGLWLEAGSVPRRRRRALKRELRANLIEAARHSSMSQAIRDLGGVRMLARAVAHDGIWRPRWQVGWLVAALAFGVIVNVEAIAALNWLSGVVDSGGHPATGTVFPFPGSVVTYEPPGFGMWIEPGWLPLVGPALAFVLAARPWRLLTGSSARPRMDSVPTE
jgi:hypothetical protein